MTFLENPPQDIRDRWKKGAEMCTAWGITTTGASVWRLYRSYIIEWRVLTSVHPPESSPAPPA